MMKILIALAAGMIATGALAQSTTTTTQSTTTTPAPMHTTMERTTGSVTHNSVSTTARRTGSVTHTKTRSDHRMMNHARRKCYNQVRNGHRVRVCRSRY